MALSNYLRQFKEAIIYKNGNAVASLLSYQQTAQCAPDLREDLVRNIMFKPWDDMVISHLLLCRYVADGRFDEAFKEQANLMQGFTKMFQALKDDNWPLPVLFAVCRDLRQVAVAADSRPRPSARKNKPHESVEKAADLLMAVFRVCATDNRATMDRSKRRGMITVINQLFKIYFRINKLPLCKPLIRALDNADMMQYFPINEKVTYNYFLGMKYLFDSDYRKSEELLTYSFLNCPKQSFKNKQLILVFLIPVKMLLGHMPRENALYKYKLTEFSPVIRAVKEGNIKGFDEAMEQGKDFFWKFGIYLILEKLRIILYRNIFKKVALIANTHQIPIQSFKVALDFLTGEKTDVEEVHCILANLIFENKIKGYISIQHQKLVVSKQNPFPPLASVST